MCDRRGASVWELYSECMSSSVSVLCGGCGVCSSGLGTICMHPILCLFLCACYGKSSTLSQTQTR